MQYFIQGCSLLLFTLISSFSSAQCYQLVWADEFNGSSLDRSKWTVVTGEGGAVSGNAELQYYLDRTQNIQVNSGSLKIIALNDGYASNAYTSARMQTKYSGDWLYGRFEARIKLPVGVGMWPAFWMMPTDSEYGIWPRSGEMDIMELIGREPSKAYGTIHTGNDGTVRTYSNVYTLSSGTFADNFHIFSMEWSPNLIKMYVDGNLYATQTPSTISPYPWVFNKRFFILLNLAIGGAWAGAPNGTTTFPQTMEVDYVRVYQKTENMSIVGKTLVEPNTTAVSYAMPNVSGITYNWTVSGAGNAIASGQGTATATVNWASQNGTVSCQINDGCAAAATATKPVTVSPNLWDNFGFEQNFVNWDTRPAYSSVVNFGISSSDFTEGGKAAQIQVVTPQANPWDIQLSRTNLNLVAGTNYTVRFKAKSNVNRSIPIAFIRSSDYGVIASQTINLTTNWQTFTLSFTPSSSVNVMFNADLATAAGTYAFDDFAFGRSAILPIEIRDFRGVAEKGGNHLHWYFEQKQGLKNIEILKSDNGRNFTTLSIEDKNAASFVDNTPSKITYYQLKINDLDGSAYFSKIISLTTKDTEGGHTRLFPNPASTILTLENWQEKDILIINTLGQVVLRQEGVQNSDGLINLNIQTLPNGMYFIKTANQTLHFFKK